MVHDGAGGPAGGEVVGEGAGAVGETGVGAVGEGVFDADLALVRVGEDAHESDGGRRQGAQFDAAEDAVPDGLGEFGIAVPSVADGVDHAVVHAHREKVAARRERSGRVHMRRSKRVARTDFAAVDPHAALPEHAFEQQLGFEAGPGVRDDHLALIPRRADVFMGAGEEAGIGVGLGRAESREVGGGRQGDRAGQRVGGPPGGQTRVGGVEGEETSVRYVP